MTGKELQELVQKSGKSKKEWAKRSKIPERTIGYIYGKEVVDHHHLVSLVDAGLYSDAFPEMVAIKKELEKTPANAQAVSNAGNGLNCYIVPVKAYGGFLNGYESKSYMNTLEKTNFPLVRGECFLFEVDGFSMVMDEAKEDSFMPGSWVVTTRLNGFSDLVKNKCYVFQTIDGILIKQFEKIENDYCHLRCLNPEYACDPIHLKDIKVLYFIELKINKA